MYKVLVQQHFAYMKDYHLMGSLLPRENEVPSFAQCYIHDSHEAVAIHQKYNGNLNADVL